MTGTCEPEKCTWLNLLGGPKEQCPNFIETVWVSSEGEKKLVADCAPKRTLLMVQELHNRLIGVQQAQEQQRNEFHLMRTGVSVLLKAVHESARDTVLSLPTD